MASTTAPACPTGITDLDLILQGGFRKGSLNILSGGAGSGRTSLAYEFLCHGAGKEECVLFTSSPKDVYKARMPILDFVAKPFDGIRLEGFVSEDVSDEASFSKTVAAIKSAIEAGADRIVVDGFEQQFEWLPAPFLAKALRELQETAFQSRSTLLITCGVFGDAEVQAADCILSLGMETAGPDAMRTLEVLRNRGAQQPLSVYVLALGKEGAMLARLMEGLDD